MPMHSPAEAVSASSRNFSMELTFVTSPVGRIFTSAPCLIIPDSTLPTLIPETATAAAAMTQTAEAIAGGAVTETPTPGPTPTALPTAGFADEVGLPGLLFLGVALLVVVFLSRRLRASASPG